MNHTDAIPLQSIHHSRTIDDYIDQYMAVVDSRYSIESFSSTTSSSNQRPSEDSLPSIDYDNNSNNSDMMRKTYYDSTQLENDDDHSHLHHKEEQSEEEQERLVNSMDDLDSRDDTTTDRPSPKGDRKWLCFLFLGILLVGWLIWTIIVNSLSPGQPRNTFSNSGNHIDLTDIMKSEFIPKRPNVVWMDNGHTDGLFTYIDPENHNVMMRSVENGTKQVLLDSADLMSGHGAFSIKHYSFSKDTQYMMLWTNVSKVWRHSSLSNIYVYNRNDKSMFPLVKPSLVEQQNQVNISHAAWSPVGHQIAYVMNNDLYITDLRSHRRITFDGSETVFNGIPDWVYEEEVLNQNFAFWWSPDATHLAYLRLDETKVPELHLPIYSVDNESYPDEKSIRYPKAGAPNPLVSLFVYALDQQTTMMVTSNATMKATVATEKDYREFDDDDRLITDVHWATDTHTHLLFKQTNRIQDKQLTNLLTIRSGSAVTDKANAVASTVHDYSPTDGGWVDPGQSMLYFDFNEKDGTLNYVELADDGNGYMHLVLIKIQQQTIQLQWLTEGEWEVEQGSVTIDRKRNLVHFLSTERSPLERHLYTISLSGVHDGNDPSATKKCLTCPGDMDTHAFYRAAFSPLAGYYVLYYDGPDIPTTILKKVDDASFELPLQKNDQLRKLLSKYELPGKRMLKIKSGSNEMNVAEILPPNFDANAKYPVLFQVYGGPGSQMVTYEFQLDWHTFLASKLEYIVVTVDGRGTGFRGRGYRVGVRGRLGELETIDQTNAARHWASLSYVDSARISIWGWSYGGYLATKCIEADSGLFSSGLAVAPVTNWRFYDSIYTERYMSTPQLNPRGYVTSAVNNMTGFANSKFLLVHGTADDNVHFQNTAILVEKLTRANIHSYKVQFYTDSDHLINNHNTNENLYFLLTDFLWESFGGEEYLHLRKETHGKFSGKIEGEGGAHPSDNVGNHSQAPS